MSLRVALYTPAWPKGELPNGIVTYASNIIPALRDVGVEVFVIAGSIAPGCADPSVAVPEVARDPLAVREPQSNADTRGKIEGLAALAHRRPNQGQRKSVRVGQGVVNRQG